MERPFEITEADSAILHLHYTPTGWVFRASDGASERAEVTASEKELTRKAARRCLDVLYDVDREFKHIELGLI